MNSRGFVIGLLLLAGVVGCRETEPPVAEVGDRDVGGVVGMSGS